MYKMSSSSAIDDDDRLDPPPRRPGYNPPTLGEKQAAQDAVESELNRSNRRGGGRRSQKRPTARRLRSSKARKARKARATRRR
jgi:hypothetical protein